MKVGFVYADFSKGAGGKFYHGIAFLSSWLKKFNHTTSLFHIKDFITKSNFISWLEKENPQLIAFTATTNVYPYIKELAKWVKEFKDIPTIIGGIHATLLPKEVINDGPFDFVCIGEGETPLSDLCQSLEKKEDFTHIRNIWVRTPSGHIENKLRPLLEDLDELPFPDREFMDYGNSYDLLQMKRGVFMASRGCPYDCSYCCNPAIKQIYNDGKLNYVRFRGVDNIISEMEEVIKNYPGIEYIAFHDDCLPLKKEWFLEFMSVYKNKISLPFSMNARIELIDEEILKMAKYAGLRTIAIGIESGNEYIRNELLNRKISNGKIRTTYEMIHRLGIKISSYNMVGFPYESFRDMLDTVKLNARINTDELQISIFYPYPCTGLYEIVKRENLLGDNILESYFEGTVLKFNASKKRQIELIFNNFEPLKIIYQIFLKLPLFIPYFFFTLLDFALRVLIFLKIEKIFFIGIRRLARYYRYLKRLMKKF